MTRSIAVSLAAVALAGCGEARGRVQPTVVNGREWRSNAVIIVRQLQQDIAGTQISGSTPATARTALRDASSLYGLLVSYSDFAGCRQMVAAAGEVPHESVRADRLLVAGCSYLERASRLFTVAVTHDDGQSLLAAGRESGLALPSLVRAAAALGGRR